MTPLVSIIVPTYNSGDRLKHCIESLLGQTLNEIEIIIVNDASTDNTSSIIETYTKSYTNVIHIELEANKGVHEARLAGLKAARASWIGFLDSDDYAKPEMFSKLLNYALKENVDIVICGSDRVTSAGKLISNKIKFPKNKRIENDIFREFSQFKFGTGMLWNKLFHKDVIKPFSNLHFPWRQDINEDLIMNIACFSKAKSLYVTKDILHEYTLNESSVTSDTNTAKAYVKTFQAFALAMTVIPNLDKCYHKYILEMYRTQINWPNYLLEDVSEVSFYSRELNDAVELLHNHIPLALALLPARQPSYIIGRKSILKYILKKSFRKIEYIINRN